MSAITHQQWLQEKPERFNDIDSSVFLRNTEKSLNPQSTEQDIQAARENAYTLLKAISQYEQQRPYALLESLEKALIKRFQFKKNTGKLEFGHCPQCDKKSLWTDSENLSYLQCSRTKLCGHTQLTADALPEHYSQLDKHYPASENNPSATADVYLAVVKALDIQEFKADYQQHAYHHPQGNRSSATVRFFVNDDKTEYWEQLLDEVTLTHKNGHSEIISHTQTAGAKNHWWMHSEQRIDIGDTVYLTKDIFSALAFNQAGFKACALLGKLPKSEFKDHLGKKITWILALDNNQRGRRTTRENIQWLKQQEQKTSAVFSTEEISPCNWNDLHQQQKLQIDDFKHYRYFGRLELTTRAIDKAQLMFEYHDKKKHFFTFGHYSAMYRVTIDKKEYDKAYSELNDDNKNSDEVSEGAFFMATKVAKESNCHLRLLHILESEIEDSLYSMHIDFENGSPSRIIYLTGSAFSSAGEFKKSIMVKAPGAQFTATAKSLDYRFDQWFRKRPMTVKTLDYAGYNKDTKAYIYNQFAVQNGNIIPVNSDDFFELKQSGYKTSVDVKQKLSDTLPKPWLEDYKTAYGKGGMILLTWWIGSLFAEQIRAETQSFPYIEVIGEGGSGKTDMINFLWKLCGKQADSFNPNSSTMPGYMRKMSQYSNLPTVFNETDDETSAENTHAKKFNWDQLKQPFEGEIGRHTGTKTLDNKTRSPLFRSSICAAQNIPIFSTSHATLSRWIHLQFDRDHHTAAGKLASRRLNLMPTEDISGFLLHTIKHDSVFLERFKQLFMQHVKTLQQNKNITMQRIIENHAKLMAVADCMPLLMDISLSDVDDIKNVAEKMAETRQEFLKKDSPRTELFWENFNFLNSRHQGAGINQENSLNHHPKPDDYIAVSLVDYFRLAKDHGLDQIPTTELHKILPSSIEYEFMDASKSVKSRITEKTKRCYVFKTPAKKARDMREAAERKGKK